MKKILNIELGKSYPSSYILKTINEFQSSVKIGHATIKVDGNDKHLYHTDLSEEQLKNLKDTELKILSIINPCEQNFAHKLIFSKETQENLKKIEAQKSLCYAVDMNDLIQAGYKFKGVNSSIHCMNCVFEKNELPFIASPHSEGKIDRKYFVKISYKAIDNTQNNINKLNKTCESLEK